jgi:hypothetical protein
MRGLLSVSFRWLRPPIAAADRLIAIDEIERKLSDRAK